MVAADAGKGGGVPRCGVPWPVRSGAAAARPAEEEQAAGEDEEEAYGHGGAGHIDAARAAVLEAFIIIIICSQSSDAFNEPVTGWHESTAGAGNPPSTSPDS